MKLASRIVVAFFGVAGAIAWSLALLALMQLGNSLGGMGDGAGTESHSLPPMAFLVIAGIWLVPMTAFVFMFLSGINVLKGAVRCVGYWYVLMFWLVAGLAMMALLPHYQGAAKLVGPAFILFAGWWGFAFREKLETGLSAKGQL